MHEPADTGPGRKTAGVTGIWCSRPVIVAVRGACPGPGPNRGRDGVEYLAEVRRPEAGRAVAWEARHEEPGTFAGSRACGLSRRWHAGVVGLGFGGFGGLRRHEAVAVAVALACRFGDVC
jgi:hypothetical protein